MCGRCCRIRTDMLAQKSQYVSDEPHEHECFAELGTDWRYILRITDEDAFIENVERLIIWRTHMLMPPMLW